MVLTEVQIESIYGYLVNSIIQDRMNDMEALNESLNNYFSIFDLNEH